jgi:hypothetical protein
VCVGFPTAPAGVIVGLGQLDIGDGSYRPGGSCLCTGTPLHWRGWHVGHWGRWVSGDGVVRSDMGREKVECAEQESGMAASQRHQTPPGRAACDDPACQRARIGPITQFSCVETGRGQISGRPRRGWLGNGVTRAPCHGLGSPWSLETTTHTPPDHDTRFVVRRLRVGPPKQSMSALDPASPPPGSMSRSRDILAIQDFAILPAMFLLQTMLDTSQLFPCLSSPDSPTGRRCACPAPPPQEVA